ncbi:CAAX geranylgeranyltransferase alpha subunit, partial [Tilletia horrida]
QQRKRIVVALDDPSRELDFTARILDIDSKNYHTWVYRQWVLCRFGGLPASSALKGTATAADVALPSSSVPSSHSSSSGTKGNTRSGRTFPELWSGELAYTDQLLEEDVRNNSAWNHRFFVLFASGRAKACEADSDSTDEAGWVRREIGFTKAKIAMTPNNASAWNYLRGISRLNPSHSTSPLRSQASFALSLIPSHAEARASPSMDSGGLTSWYALEWLLDCEQEAAQQQLSASSSGAEQAQSESKRQIEDQTRLILARLLVADPMRKRYWHYKAERILSTLDRV